jgi:DNA-directed RNA polymerase specialized sigma24 family protein
LLMEDFERDVYPLFARYTRWWFARDEDKRQDALAWAWLLWTRADMSNVSLARIAKIACLYVMRDEPWPGLRSEGKGKVDTMKHASLWGDMSWYADRKPGPDRTATARDALAYLERSSRDGRAAVLHAIVNGATCYEDVARRCGVHRSTVKWHLNSLRAALRSQGW